MRVGAVVLLAGALRRGVGLVATRGAGEGSGLWTGIGTASCGSGVSVTRRAMSSSVGRAEIAGEQDDEEREPGQLLTTVQSWQERIGPSIGKSRKIKGGNYVQLATVESDPDTGSAIPKCRTVVFRGFLQPDTGASSSSSAGSGPVAMKMITDARSEKVAQIAKNPAAEMVWWFSRSSEQYRFRGSLLVVGAEGVGAEAAAAAGWTGDAQILVRERVSMWKQLSDPAREQFFWQHPGLPYSASSDVNPIPTGGKGPDGAVLPPPDTFLLLLLLPKEVKYLRLADNYAQKCSLFEELQWTSARVTP